MGRVTRVNLHDPDNVKELPGVTLHLATVGPLTIGKGVVQPGFRWSTHMRGPADDELCRVHHLQMLMSGRFAVEMDDGEYVELEPGDVFDVPPGHDAWVVGDEPAVLLDFLGNIEDLGVPSELDREVLTLLMTDIVDSTAWASRMGDTAWRQLLGDHNRIVRDRLDRFRGTEVNTTGDGFLVTFTSALGALRCAESVTRAVRGLGIEVRAGVHTGEVEMLKDDVGGVAVHACARIMGLAGASEVLCSSATRALIDGSDLSFEERGQHELKGLKRPVEVFALMP